MSFTVYTIVFSILGILLFISAVRRLKKRQIISATSRGLISVLILGLATLFGGLGMSLYTYQRLTTQQAVADVLITESGPNEFELRLTLFGGKKLVYKMIGDGWRLDAKVIIWKPQASLFGLDPVYKLDGIQNQYKNRELTNIKTITSHKLSENSGIEAVNFLKKNKKWLPWLEAAYGSSVYMPFANRARYKVSITLSGLKAKAANKEAETAVANWEQ